MRTFLSIFASLALALLPSIHMAAQHGNYYPFGAVIADISTNASLQKHKYSGKELDLMHGLNTYDFGARQYDPLLGMWDRNDSICENSYHLQPYTFCNNKPTVFIDTDGNKTYLYATTLPGVSSLFSAATHTFIVVTDNQGNIKNYFAYGSSYEGANGAFSGQLERKYYQQDLDIIKGTDKEHLKKKILITPPSGMSSEQFDKTIIKVANSFGNNPFITYSALPISPTQENCNTSTSTILLKAGISTEMTENIEAQIPGINTGFDSFTHPWTKEEQKEVVDTEQKIRQLQQTLKLHP